MEPKFVARCMPDCPMSEWASGLEDGAVFYPSLYFRTRAAAVRDAAAMNAALRANPKLVDELLKLITR